MYLRRILLASSVLLVLLCIGGFHYLKTLGLFSSRAVYAKDTIAIAGYDTVAYFTQAQAIPGQARHRYDWNGAQWWFASDDHRELFAAEPEAYAPQFGGYSAYAMSEGYTARSDPRAWAIVDDRLYLNFNRSVAEQWVAEQASRIATARQHWALMRPSLRP